MELIWFNEDGEEEYVKFTKDKFKKHDNIISIITRPESDITLVMFFPRGSIYTKKIRKPRINIKKIINRMR